MWMLHTKWRRNVFQVMEKAEHLRDADANILPAFLRLQELVRKCSSHFAFVLKLRFFFFFSSAWMIKRRQKSRFSNEWPWAERAHLFHNAVLQWGTTASRSTEMKATSNCKTLKLCVLFQWKLVFGGLCVLRRIGPPQSHIAVTWGLRAMIRMQLYWHVKNNGITKGCCVCNLHYYGPWD